MVEVAQAASYPLDWPDGYSRSTRRSRARYQVEFGQAYNELAAELRRMGAQSIVISTNVPLNGKGEPYKDAGSRKFEDPGASVYFFWKEKQWTIACDSWDLVKDNIRALGMTISGLRQIERCGAGELLQRAHSAFKALPPPGGSSGTSTVQVSEQVQWHHILEVDRNASAEVIDAAYKAKAKLAHPDHGGSSDEMSRLNVARSEALRGKVKRTPVTAVR